MNLKKTSVLWNHKQLKIINQPHLKKNFKKSAWKKNIYKKNSSIDGSTITFVNINCIITESMINRTFFWNIGSNIHSIKIKRGRVNYKFRHISSKLL